MRKCSLTTKKYSLRSDGNKSLSPHFKVKEFRCKDGSDTIYICPQIIDVLEQLFNFMNAKAINIISGYRTNSHSVKVGGYAGDVHTRGIACDINVRKQDGNLYKQKDILIALEDMGFNHGIGRIGSDTNVHIDMCDDKCWFDETNGSKTVNSWREYYGEGKAVVNSHKGTPYTMTCDWLNVRKVPNGKIVGRYSRGEIFYVIQIVGDWVQLESGNWMCATKWLKRM